MNRAPLLLVLLVVAGGACSKRVISLEGLACASDEDCIDGWACTTDGVCEQVGSCDQTGTLANCSRCGDDCSALDHVTAATCEPDGATFACVIGECEAGWIDANGEPGNGCEAECTATGAETCDGTDNDCDGVVDNGFTLGADCGSGDCAGGVTVCRTDGTGATCSTDGTACGDGVCNECSGGICATSPVGSPGPGCDAAAAGECDFADTCDTGGICNANIAGVGDPCGDGVCNECNDLGACVESTPGSPGPGCNDVTDDECTTPDSCLAGGACERNHTANGTPCADGVCNECTSGICQDSPVGAAGPGCADTTDTDCTNPETCAPGGVCAANHESDGTACGDRVCNECFGGACGDSPPDAPGPGCTGAVSACAGVDNCDGGGNCNTIDPPDGTPCDADGDLNFCEDSCRSGICEADRNASNGRPCTDGVFCNGTETCDGGVCTNSTGDPCVVNLGDADSDCSESCNEAAGDCSANDPTDSSCDNGSFCDGDETCTAGVCGSSTGDPCAGDVGDADTDCSESCNEGTNSCTASDPDGSFCDNGDFCDGEESCQGGTCGSSTGNPCPGDDVGPDCNDSCDEGANDCTGNDAGGTPCGDGTFCNGDETCGGGACGNSDGNPCPGHDTGPACNDSCNEAAGNCLGNDADSTVCDDGTFCNGTETCTTGLCGGSNGNPCPGHDTGPDCDDSCNESVGDCTADDAPSTPCSDGTFCNGTETCNGGACGGSTGNPCPGHDAGPSCDDSCNEGGGDCTGFDTAGTGCDDGVACTLAPDTCDDAGVCGGGAFDDSYCQAIAIGDVCWPPCSARPSGCVTPPTGLALSCASPVNVDTASTCSLTLTGGDNGGQAACLPCAAKVGVKELGFTDFDDGSGVCSLDGWTLRSGNFCYSGAGSCPMTSANDRTCCTNFDCPTDIGGALAFQADKATCGTEQWRLERQFDTTGLTDVQVCFDYAGVGATGDEVIQIDIDAGGSYSANVFCDTAGPRDSLDGEWFRICVDLPAAADNEPALDVIFFLQSNNGDDQIAIDNVVVTGWGGGCSPVSRTAMSDDFEGCDLSNWTSLGTPTCPGQTACDGSDNLWVEGDTWTIARTVDASALDGQVELCFDVFDDHADSGELFAVGFDTGSGWQPAWNHAGSLGDDNQCGQICVNLSNIDRAVNNNPALGVRFILTSDANDDELSLDNVLLRGAEYCPATVGVVSLSDPIQFGAAVGAYTFTATDSYSEPLAADISCEWQPDPTLHDTDSVSFDP